MNGIQTIQMQDVARRVVVALLRLYLWIIRKNGLLCRACGAPVALEDAWSFVYTGCPTCGGVKLDAR